MRAVIQRRTAKDLVAEFIRQGLGMSPAMSLPAPAAGSLVVIDGTGVPEIRCRPDAPATRMSVEDLLKLEHETQSGEDAKRAGIPV